MNLFSHVVLAGQLEPQLIPENSAEYYWGTVAPDIRYLAGLPRSVTHFSHERMQGYQAQYAELRSFLLGYRVHCLLDELDLVRILGSRFPLRLVRRQLSLRQAAMLVELYYQKQARFSRRIRGSHNAFLQELGVELAQVKPLRARSTATWQILRLR